MVRSIETELVSCTVYLLTFSILPAISKYMKILRLNEVDK